MFSVNGDAPGCGITYNVSEKTTGWRKRLRITCSWQLPTAPILKNCIHPCAQLLSSLSAQRGEDKLWARSLNKQTQPTLFHLLLLGVNRVNPTLSGEAHIISDCLGALFKKFKDLPPYRIPSRCRHSNTLKNILVYCSDLSFQRTFSHVKAHQSDKVAFHLLPRESKLNEGFDAKAKKALRELDPGRLPRQRNFPLELIIVYVDGKNDFRHRRMDQVLGAL